MKLGSVGGVSDADIAPHPNALPLANHDRRQRRLPQGVLRPSYLPPDSLVFWATKLSNTLITGSAFPSRSKMPRLAMGPGRTAGSHQKIPRPRRCGVSMT